MTTVLCTLYNSLYLDKGLVLYDSLCECAKDFKLYVLCMDDKCFDVLSDIGEGRLKPIRLSDIENKQMLDAKSNRNIAEYCWTCSSRLIQYILEKFQPECCTYIDADMYFYHDPQILVDEMLLAGKSVMMVPHRFTEKNMRLSQTVGTYCVEFNCFKNDAAGREVLNHWHNRCLECCSNIGDGIHWGDQKYMDEWPVLFAEYVHVCENAGAGIAPWNIELYKSYNNKDNSVLFVNNQKRISIIFFHFQSIKYITKYLIDTSLKKDNGQIDYVFAKDIYTNYLLKIDAKKNYLIANYNINNLIQEHPSKSKNGAFVKYFNPKFLLIKIIEEFTRKVPYVIDINNENDV